MRRPTPTALAALLTAVAVALPIVVWLLVGGRQLAREDALRRSALLDEGRIRLLALAEPLGARLGALRTAESRRPFYHYQNLFHDPHGASEGAAVSQSPLASGGVDPLIRAHFQVDAEGRLTLPTLNEDFPELNTASHCGQHQALEQVARACAEGAAMLGLDPRAGGDGLDVNGQVDHVELLSRDGWRQHLEAGAVYADLRRAGRVDAERAAPRDPRRPTEGVFDATGPLVAVRVGAMGWHTLPVDDQPGLVALRGVDTPAGLWAQGFAIDRDAIAAAVPAMRVGGVDLPIALVPAATALIVEPSAPTIVLTAATSTAPIDPGATHAPIGDTGWQLAVDLTPALIAADQRAVEARHAFLTTVLLCAFAAAIAGFAVVLLVHRSERLAALRARFAASAAHELRTPLAGLRLYGEMLADDLGDANARQRYARRIADDAARLSRVVGNMLSVSRLERRALRLSPRDGDLASAVDDAVQRQRPALEAAGLPVTLQRADAAPVPARFDADALVQIVHNLLDNAEKYSRDADDRRAVVRVDAPGGRPRMIIADGGPGLPRPLQRRAFKPFARGAAPDGPAGLGLGLALVNALARAQDGRVTYCGGDAGGRDALPNDLPDGACFVLTLPPAHDARSHLARRRDADDGKHAAIVDRAAGG